MSEVRPKVKPVDIHLHAAQPKTKFTFDISKPLKIGYLGKQKHTGLIKSFKESLFILYPNFLVYYKDSTEWQYDKTVGGLGSRKGAIKLTKGRVQTVTSPEVLADSKFPFILHVPDNANKRETYVLEATSEEECESWMEAITKAIQTSEEADKK